MDRSRVSLIVFLCMFHLASTGTKGGKHPFDEDACKEPEKPEFSKMSCIQKSFDRRECKVKCKRGYVHEDGKRVKTFYCDAVRGGWDVYPLPGCRRKCEPPCENQGKCASNNECICTPEYRGKTCQYEVSLCDPTTLGEGYVSNCNHTSEKSSCILDCPEGMQFASPPADVYDCSLQGIWSPSSAPGCESLNVIYASEKPNIPVSNVATEPFSSKSSGVCAAWGQFHYRTFDGRIFSFHGPCTYLLAKDCKTDSFSIHISDSPECNQEISCSQMITIYIGDESYHLEETNGQIKMKLLGEEIAIPGIAGTLQLERLAQYLIVTSSLGFRLKWDGKRTILLSINDNLKNVTCGLCGQYDGFVSNDFETISGKVADNVISFADSWKMPRIGEKCSESLRDDHGCTYKTSEEKAIAEAAHKACYAIYDESYAACHDILDPEPYFTACKTEFCGCKEQAKSCICDTLAEYFRECTRLGGKIHGGWRKPDICSLDCPAGMEYTDCGSSCPKTCRQTEYECYNEHCIDGCHCQAGMLLHKGECIPEVQCPCTHGDVEYSPGEKIPNDCNQCECLGGKWECTEKACNGRCTSTGVPHYKTFDGYKYQFNGKCSYYLVYHDNFTIIQDNSLCADSELNKKFCEKPLIIDAHSTQVLLKHNMEVTVNGQDINKFPFTNKDVKIQKTSSTILLDIINGVSLTWDGLNNVYIDAPASLMGTTQGLCGTFNHNTKDDLTTPDGAIEALVDDFGEKWKTDLECKKQIASVELQDPCDTYKEKEEDARALCSVLKSEVFKGCHHEEDPEPFYKDCLYDMCMCKEETKNCLCPALANYAAACVKKDVSIFWRLQVKECEIQCEGGQTYQECSNPCAYSCKSLSVEKCNKKCVEGCACSEGTALSLDGICIPISQCPCFHEGKEYPAKSTRVVNGLLSCECHNGQWNCKSTDYDKGNEMMAYESESCNTEKNFVYNECVKCPQTCQNYFIQPKCDTSTCRSGCSCKEGYVLDTTIGNCVKIEDCGCMHGGKRFPEGSSHKRDCNKCTCVKGKWVCEHNECAGMCNVWGESHFKTFDGHYYDFQGSCEYILVKGNSSDGNFFQVVMETKICGTSGVTCAKGVRLQLGDEVKLSLSRDEELPKPSYDAPFIVRKVGLYVFVYTRIGVIIQWDRGSFISVHVKPKWKGKLAGLCGDFNDDQADDFKTPSFGPIEARPNFFGDSWKLNAACPFPQDIVDTCTIHPDRKPWAKKRCSVLTSDIFKPCHKFVSFEPFYERCIFDTCGCDLGEDCECFCTAVATYAEECLIHGIAIPWRSQELCPIQCEGDEVYKPCMSTCPKETCETKYLYDDIKKECNNEPCVEGCEPKPCPGGQLYDNDRDFKCIFEIECEVPCKEINGRLYVEGERVMDYNIVDSCQTCHCQRGNIVCTGQPCRNVTQLCKSTGWSKWMNSPTTASGDYERLNDPLLQKVYFKLCTPEYITKLQCRATFSLIPFEYTGQKGVCELPVGLICNDDEQNEGQCNDYEIRVFCDCELATEPSVTESVTEYYYKEAKCVAPGWTHWMNVNTQIDQGEGDIATELRKYYVFCPDEEIEEAECRVSSTKHAHKFGEKTAKCTRNGMKCHSGVVGTQCPNYEIRFYCRCEGTECAYPRGMETGIIGDSQITTKSVLRLGYTEGYHARLNGPWAWTPRTNVQQEWIQVDLGKIQQVTGVITQGSPNALQWVERYRVYYSLDGLLYENIYDTDGNEMIFQGNSDQDTPVTNFFPSPVRARYIRIYPYQWHQAISLRLELLGCNVHVPTVTELPSTTSLSCSPGWTEFINTDSPDYGDGDHEKIENILKTYDICSGGEISDIECKALINGERVNYDSTGDYGVTCKISVGSYCSNFLQGSNKLCKDYAVRLYCKCEETVPPTTNTPVIPTTMIPQVCGWTEWLNIDKPKSFKTDAGDIESIEKLQQYYGVCQKPYLKSIECRMALTLHDWTSSLQNELRCDTDVGFVCYNRLQVGDCYDYEVRAYCLYDWCPESSTIMPTIQPTSPCPPNQYYDDCAYTCNQTCSDYLYKLHLVGKCQTEDDHCIGTCRPYESCEYPYLWKDPYTCVKKSDCGCVTPNGDYINAGDVVHIDCEKCQCYDNSLNCVTAPECRSTLSSVELKTETIVPTTEVPYFTIPTVETRTETIVPTTELPYFTIPTGSCPDEMVLKNFNISVSQITVSSEGLLSGKDRIRINTPFSNEGTGGWSPKVSDQNQYVQIDFGTPRYISAIVTQGENGIENWVTKYSVEFSFDGKLWRTVKEGNQTKIFAGNYDSDTSITNHFQYMIKTRYLRVVPYEWHNWIAMRLDVIGCLPFEEIETTAGVVLGHTATTASPSRECTREMVFPIQKGIPPGLITVSSAESEFSGPSRLKINTKGGPEGTGGWKAAVNDNNQFVLIDFQEVRNLSAVVIQGQEDEDNWVTSFVVKYSTDNKIWKNVNDEKTGHMFRGNADHKTREIRWFNEIIFARYVKVIPTTFHGAIAMRLEVLGCYKISEGITEMTTLPPTTYCPELPETLKENCPYCTLGHVCDGLNCVYPEDCPCYVEGSKHRIGSKFETSDCQECTCRMHGRSYCEKKKCLFCPLDYRSILTPDCQCECRKCPEGTVRCPSDDQCIDENKWCDGKVDCEDDEVNCPYTTSSITFTPTTIGPETCTRTLNENAATCELNTGYFETFDGKNYEVDICDHILFREKYFQIYSVKIHKDCIEGSTYCRRYIVIDVDYFNIKIGPGPNKVEFNGAEVLKTKFHLLSKRFKEFILRTEGTLLRFVSLKYGFEVIWDSHDNVKIKVADCLLKEVNGLCGFYDGVKENDFQKPDGAIARNVESFTESWSIGPSDRCVQFICDYHMKLAADQMCSSLEDSVFKDCNHAVDMERQKEICVASACECLAQNYTTPDCTCQVLESFLQYCEESLKVTVEDAWRVDFSCVPKCPPGLEWKDCGPSCELTCDNFQDKNLACLKKCTPGCFCPTGLVRREDKCIDATLCHDCVCVGFGDPNYQTFDHVSYAFQGSCTYVLVHHQKNDNHPNLEVYVTNTECPQEPGTTCTTGLQVVHNNNVVTIVRNQPVRFNDQVLDDVVYNFYQNGINITATKEHVMVYIEENHLIAQYIVPNYGYVIKLPSKLYYNETAGLCGVCNFDARDDLYHRDGYISEDVNDFAYSWLVNGSKETCKLKEVLPSPPSKDVCKFEENECELYVDPAPYVKACENDVSYSRNMNYSLCNTVLQYAATCCEYGVILDDWIKSIGCEFLCPQGMEFQCKSLCHLTCSNYKKDPTDCEIPPEYMCSCPGNQVMKDGECVHPIYCEACDDEGHKVGERWNVDLCQSCECLPNLKVVCEHTVCPTAPSCPPGTALQVIDNGTCCDQYVCEYEATKCPPATIPPCPKGAAAKLITTHGCPEYQCECDISLCPPLRNISHLEPGEEEIIETDGCCVEQLVKCNYENCPPTLLCGVGSKLIEKEGKCCTFYECSKVEKCIYKHRFDVFEGLVNESTLEENIKLYEVGETWMDGLCLTCRCNKESEQFIYSCESEKCVEPSYVSNQTDYTYEQHAVSGKCCPEYVRTGCLSNGTIYQVGDEWPSSYGDKCTSYKCTLGENGEIEKVKNILSCNKSCPAYAQYVDPPPGSSDCCGYCEPFACEEDGKIYNIGEKWVPHSKTKCIVAECVQQNGRIEKILTGKQCPLIPIDCPDEHKTMDESGCCELCEIIPGACEVRNIPLQNTRHYFYLYDKAKGACFNKEPIENLTECSGSCHSENTFSSSLDIFTTLCNCCTPGISMFREITLHCENNSTIVKEYKQPKTCNCISCSLEKVITLEEPPPKK